MVKIKLTYNLVRTKRKDGYDKHHMFTHFEIKKKLLKLIQRPVTEDEWKRFDKLVQQCWNIMPRLRIPRELHRRIHK